MSVRIVSLPRALAAAYELTREGADGDAVGARVGFELVREPPAVRDEVLRRCVALGRRGVLAFDETAARRALMNVDAFRAESGYGVGSGRCA